MRAPRPLSTLSRTISLGLILAITLLVGATACKPATVTDSSRQLYCQVIADSPVRDHDETPRKIIGRVRYTCDPPGMDALSLTLRLQRQNASGRWVDAAKTSFTVRKAQTTSPEGERYRVREVSVACNTGVYRTLVNGTSKARGFTSTYEQTGARNFDPCRPSLFSER